MCPSGSLSGYGVWQCGTYVRTVSETPTWQRSFLTVNVQVTALGSARREDRAQTLITVARPAHSVVRASGSAGSGEGGRAEHGVDGVLVAVQTGVGQQGGGAAGDRLGDRFDD
jgi:hypothetical protein